MTLMVAGDHSVGVGASGPLPPLSGVGGGESSDSYSAGSASPGGSLGLAPAARAVRSAKPDIQRRARSPLLAMPLAPWCSGGAWSGHSGMPSVDRPRLSCFRLALWTAVVAEPHPSRADVATPCCFPVSRCLVGVSALLCRCRRFGVLCCRLRRAARGDSSCIEFVLHLDLPGHPLRFVARTSVKEKCVYPGASSPP